jgi:polar amino acid transport system substrate-binding protein
MKFHMGWAPVRWLILSVKGVNMRMGKSWQWLVVATLTLAGSIAWAQSDTIASAKQKGKIVIGVRADYKPFGYTDPSGKIDGLEIELANDVAKRLGVGIELVSVTGANRMEFLKQGRIDLIIATMSYTPARAEVVGIPEPLYYASAATVFAKKNSGLKSWADIKGKPICSTEGAYFNRRVGDEFGAQLVVFKGITEALSALEGGNCVGVVNDNTLFAGIMGDARWADYSMLLPPIEPSPWGLGVRKEDTKFAAYVSDMIKDWHKTGFILGLEKKWGIPQSPYLVEQQAKFK